MRILAANDVIASTVKEIGKQFRQVGSQLNHLAGGFSPWLCAALYVAFFRHSWWRKRSGTSTTKFRASRTALKVPLHHHPQFHLHHHHLWWWSSSLSLWSWPYFSSWHLSWLIMIRGWKAFDWDGEVQAGPGGAERLDLQQGHQLPRLQQTQVVWKRSWWWESRGEIRISCQFARSALSCIFRVLQSTPIVTLIALFCSTVLCSLL